MLLSRKASGSHRVTIADIAAALDLSPSAVSLGLRDSSKISPEMIEKIKATARSMGYVYNRHAANLRQGRQSLLGVCINDFKNPVFIQFVQEIEENLKSTPYRLTLWNTSESVELQSDFLRSSLEYGVAGVLLCPAVETTRADLTNGIPEDFPIVCYSRTIDDPAVTSIASDDFDGSRQAVRHLFELGHRHIAWLGGGQSTSTATSRLAGFHAAAAELGMQVTSVEHCPTSREAGYRHVHNVLSTSTKPTGIVSFSDLVALGAVAACEAAGISVGRDVSIIGHDDIDECRFSLPPLTSVHVDKAQIAALAVKQLLMRLENPHQVPERVRVKPTLVVRQSTGRI